MGIYAKLKLLIDQSLLKRIRKRYLMILDLEKKSERVFASNFNQEE